MFGTAFNLPGVQPQTACAGALAREYIERERRLRLMEERLECVDNLSSSADISSRIIILLFVPMVLDKGIEEGDICMDDFYVGLDLGSSSFQPAAVNNLEIRNLQSEICYTEISTVDSDFHTRFAERTQGAKASYRT